MNKFQTAFAGTVYPSPEQKKLNRIFLWCVDRMKYWNIDHILFTGDLIQGKNLKDQARSLVTADLEEQLDLASSYLFKNLVCKFPDAKIYGVTGTGYHQSIDTDIERRIIEGFGGTYLHKMAWLKVPDSKRIINFAHESATGRIYPFSTMEREASGMMKAYGEGKLPLRPDIIIRGHQHLFGHLHTSTYHFILVPSFQVWYPYLLSYYGFTQPDIGIAILFIDDNDRIIVHHYTRPVLDARIGDKIVQME